MTCRKSPPILVPSDDVSYLASPTTMAPGLDATTIALRMHTSLAMSTILLFEYFTTLEDEIALVWRRPVSIAKGLYVVSRYLTFIVQIIGQINLFSFDPSVPFSRHRCIAWHSFQTIVFQILLFVVECIQAMKVHAIYANRPRVLLSLHTFRAATFIAITYTTATTLKLLSYDGACIVGDIPWHVVGFSVTAISSQIIVLFWGLSPTAFKDMWRQSSLIAIMTRDSFFTFFVVTALLAIIMSHAAVLAHVIPPVFITVLSISGCRMIIHMLSLATNSGETVQTGSVHLTMYIGGASMSESPSIEG